jgi:hypothetical protein
MASSLARSGLLWTIAVVLTIVSAAWQRLSGPTIPARGQVALGGETIRYRLDRAHAGSGDQPVRIEVADRSVTGEVRWRRYPSDDAWQTIVMTRDGRALTAALPNQPHAGKLEYQVRLARGGETVVAPDRVAITRFKGDISLVIFAPHLAAMFLALLFGTRAGLAALAGQDFRRLTWWAVGCLAVGGFVFGPGVQKQAFDEWWAGVPYGWDLTDNKTVVAGLAWAVAAWQVWRGRGRAAVVTAAIVTLAVFAIPHSAWGSQIDWRARP